MAKNIAESIKQKLINRARERGDDFNLVLIRYIHERLLFRLSQSRFADDFIVKGATLFTLWQGEPHRATKDLDLLGRGTPNIKSLRDIFEEISGVKVENDGLSFNAASIVVEAIREEAIYDGLRVHIPVAFGSARTVIQIDIGYGDSIVPTPMVTDFPTLLDQPAPRLKAYAKETVIAEKFHAMVDLGMANSRLKDFYDIHFLLKTFRFDKPALAEAIAATFDRRKTPIPQTTPVALTSAFYDDEGKIRAWEAFKRRAGIESQIPLREIALELREFFASIIP